MEASLRSKYHDFYFLIFDFNELFCDRIKFKNNEQIEIIFS